MAKDALQPRTQDAHPRIKRPVGRPRKDSAPPEDIPRRIKEAALELFAAKGFHGTGVNEIGDRAGIQRGSLYYHIGSKEALLWEIFADHLKDSLDGAARIATGTAPPTEKLRALIHHQVVLVIAQRLEMIIYQRDVGALQSERAEEVQANVDAVAAHWRSVVAEGYSKGVFNTDDPVVINGIISMVNLTHRWFHPDGADSPDEIADKLAAFAIRGLGVPQ
jgi:TetR/AcrR family transcriptional regulator, cholesterol catabolism regulator